MIILIILLIVIISEHRHGEGSNRNCGVSHVLTFMYTVVKMKMATSSGAHVEKIAMSSYSLALYLHCV